MTASAIFSSKTNGNISMPLIKYSTTYADDNVNKKLQLLSSTEVDSPHIFWAEGYTGYLLGLAANLQQL